MGVKINYIWNHHPVIYVHLDLTRPAFQEEKSSPSHLRVQQKAEPQRRSDVDHMAQFARISLIVTSAPNTLLERV